MNFFNNLLFEQKLKEKAQLSKDLEENRLKDSLKAKSNMVIFFHFYVIKLLIFYYIIIHFLAN